MLALLKVKLLFQVREDLLQVLRFSSVLPSAKNFLFQYIFLLFLLCSSPPPLTKYFASPKISLFLISVFLLPHKSYFFLSKYFRPFPLPFVFSSQKKIFSFSVLHLLHIEYFLSLELLPRPVGQKISKDMRLCNKFRKLRLTKNPMITRFSLTNFLLFLFPSSSPPGKTFSFSKYFPLFLNSRFYLLMKK